MAEAILSRAVIVVEGATEAALFPVTSELLERFRGEAYEHIDLSGVSIFNAGSDKEVPPFGPFFKALGKPAFAFYDKQEDEPDEVVAARLADFNQVWESPEKGIEDMLIGEMPVATLRRFLESAKNRDDYPVDKGTIEDGMSDEDIERITRSVLKVRKGDNQPYAALLIAECLTEAELPETIVTILDTVHAFLSYAAATPPQNGGGEFEVPEGNIV